MSKRKAPYWQTTPCPTWCGSFHSAGDFGPDRAHYSEWLRQTKLTQHAAAVRYENSVVKVDVPKLQVSLHQGDRESVPLVIVGTEGGKGLHVDLNLTVDEAKWLIKSLVRAVDLAEQ